MGIYQENDAMEWSSTHIDWDLQMYLMWTILPPIFIGSMLLTLFLPKLLYPEVNRNQTPVEARAEDRTGQAKVGHA